MCEKKEFHISVRELIEFVMRSGSIDTGFISQKRALEGTKAHKKLQKSYGNNYEAEVPLSIKLELDDSVLIIEGRADGIIHPMTSDQNNNIIIDEIKTVTRSLELIDENYNPLHLAQAKCYAYMYICTEKCKEIGVQLTYFNIYNDETKKILKFFSDMELEHFFISITSEYTNWINREVKWEAERNYSIKKLSFPFPYYRLGQREIAVSVYRNIVSSNISLIQAPTGTGKTMSVLFPAIKALGEGKAGKLFYLTAKSTAKSAAEGAADIMRQNGIKLKSLTITSKEKICFKDKVLCTPEFCEYADGHFDRVNNAILDIIDNEDCLDKDTISTYSKKHCVCPFEFSLDLSLLADCIICDYNYLFDPSVYLKRFFSEANNEYVFLIDEAHNLPDRARDMYSASLKKQSFVELKKLLKDEKESRLYKSIHSINKFMIDIRKNISSSFEEIKELDSTFIKLVYEFSSSAEERLSENGNSFIKDSIIDAYFDVLSFLRISEFYNEKYTTLIEKRGNEIIYTLYCLDPSEGISLSASKGKSSVFFSATLTPIKYYMDMLGMGQNSKTLVLNSPFDKRNRCILIADGVSTRYSQREKSYEAIALLIGETVKAKIGNYIVFFPSYSYMEKVYEVYSELYGNDSLFPQKSLMTEDERDEYLNAFIPDPVKTRIGFCVLGGVFSEGVDLKEDRLIGIVVVGPGLPQLCTERDIIKNYYDSLIGLGFEYSYMYPGMNKVFQAAGRLIRTERDRGVILLIDERFSYPTYKKLYPPEWFPNRRVNKNNIADILKEFWSSSQQS